MIIFGILLFLQSWNVWGVCLGFFVWYLFVYVLIERNKANSVYIFFNDNHTDHPSVWIPYI